MFSGNKGYHLYWLLNQFLPAEKWQKLQKGWLEWCRKNISKNIDAKVSNLSRYLRIPCFKHPKSGKDVEILDYLYHIEHNPDVFPVEEKKKTPQINIEKSIFVSEEKIDEIKNIISKYWNPGNRNSLALGLAGFLRKNGLGFDETYKIVLHIAEEKNDEEIESRLKAVEETFKKDISEIAGVDWLSDILSENEIKNLKKILCTKKRILLPKEGKLVSEFASEIAEILRYENILFFRTDSRDIIEIGKIKNNEDENYEFLGFIKMTPSRFITLVEKYATPGIYKQVKIKNEESEIKKNVFKKKSMHTELANTVLNSEILQMVLPRIDRIFTVPIPIIHNGEITFPKRGYDKRFRSWLPYDAPEIDTNMSLEEAKSILYDILKEFCFQSEQDMINAIAAILTPFIRGLLPTFNTRTPVFFYIGNRERCGKDYLAGITGILYEGYALEEPPISTNENKKSSSNEELRKKILAAMISGRKRLHFSNNKGFINNAVFESIITAKVYSDRILGRSEILTFNNELDFSLSGNTGVGFTPDFANRCVFIHLFLDIEDANSRKFERPNLHQYVEENRSKILSALYALCRNWFDKGRKPGSVPFASFPEWAEVCGGIMEAAGYENPCKQTNETSLLGGDVETTDMRELFKLCYDKYPETWIKKTEIRRILEEEDIDIFSYYDFSKKSDQIKFGNLITKFTGRILADIKMIVKDPKVRPSRQEFMFTKNLLHRFSKKGGNVGNLGNVHTPVNGDKKIFFGIMGIDDCHHYQHYQDKSEEDDKNNTVIQDSSKGNEGVEEKCSFRNCDSKTNMKTPYGTPICMKHLKNQIELLFISENKQELDIEEFVHILPEGADELLLREGFWAEHKPGKRKLYMR